MSGLSLGFVVEALVAILLLVTIGYCVLVNRKLESLRSDKSELRAIIRDLHTATGQAQKAFASLQADAGAVNESLGDHLARARSLQGRLAAQTEHAEALLSKLSVISPGGGDRAPSAPAAMRAPAPAVGQAASHGRHRQVRHSDVGLGLLNAQQRTGPAAGTKEVA